MQTTLVPRIKICCIASVEEAAMAVAGGASALGLVSAMPSGPGPISEGQIAEIAETIPPAIGSFLLTSRQDVDVIIKQQQRCRTNTIQLCDSLTRGTHADLKSALPGVSIVQVIHVTGPESVEEALAVAPMVDAILLDSGNPALAVKELGGTGRAHNWALSRKIREQVDVPVFLAGGLTAEDVVRAIEAVHPFGVDLCSGVRSNGILDAVKLARFLEAVASVDSHPAR